MTAGFSDDDAVPYAWIQWKGTDICMDFYCDCGAQCHFDGYFAYTIECSGCKTIWEMPTTLSPRRADEKTDDYWRSNPLREDVEHDEVGR